ncbi:3-hydroxyacyl-CoA dehydrogenase family protein [Peribacillus sp. Hz7]|uniref:3-hydroxyacyl-CoA dehydrogenase family protein n=1 Tax=Peribacillus sp. Hz7 TaxID=3344873 RepID=UPI0035C9F76F
MELFVIGGGLMGSGIAQVAAQSGMDVCIADINQEGIDLARKRIRDSLSHLERKGKIEDSEGILSRIEFQVYWDGIENADVIIEAVPENLELKKNVFKQIDKVAKEGALLASNTSCLSITNLGAVTRRPEQVIGMHFFSPVPMMPLLEIVKGHKTSTETVQRAIEVGKRLGKQIIVAQKDFPGFLMNRIWLPMVNEACYAVMEGVGTPEDIDQGFVSGYGHTMGPLKTIDMAGLDVALAAMEALYEGFGDPKYRPCPLLKNMVAAGDLGRKSGKGFYTYEKRTLHV